VKAALSPELRAAIKLSAQRQYRLALAVGVHPTTLSAWLNGIIAVRVGDLRILRLAELLGVPADHVFVVVDTVQQAINAAEIYAERNGLTGGDRL
jgi:transcriptional regulator with XRE-family HTH domain